MELSNWNWLYNATDKLTRGWLKHGARLLQQVTASAKASNAGSGAADDMQRFPSNASTSSWQSVCGDAFGHTMMDQHLTKLMQKTSGLGVLLLLNLGHCFCYFYVARLLEHYPCHSLGMRTAVLLLVGWMLPAWFNKLGKAMVTNFQLLRRFVFPLCPQRTVY